MRWLTVVSVVASVYVFWMAYIFLLTISLKEIRRSSWHYKFYGLSEFFSARKIPPSICYYRKILWLRPTAIPVEIILFIVLYLIFAVVVVFRFAWHWILAPLLVCQIPSDGFSRQYFRDLVDADTLPDAGRRGISMKLFAPLRPWLCALISIVVFLSSHGFYYLVNRYGVPIITKQAVFYGGFFFLFFLALVFISKIPLKRIKQSFKEKFCPNVPVID